MAKATVLHRSILNQPLGSLQTSTSSASAIMSLWAVPAGSQGTAGSCPNALRGPGAEETRAMRILGGLRGASRDI